MHKKKYIILYVILLLIFAVGLFSTCYANFADLESFETAYKQVLRSAYYVENETNLDYYTFYNLLSANIYAQYKNNIPFAQYTNCLVRKGTFSSSQKRVDIFLWNSNATYYVTSDGTLKTNTNISMNYAISFLCDNYASNYTLNWERYNQWDWNTDHSSFNIRKGYSNMSLVFIDGQITNQSTYTIIGKNYTCYVIVPNTTTTLTSNVGQYRLGEGFIGTQLYNDRQNITYKIYDNYNNVIQLNEIDYTPVNEGYTTRLYINRQDIISGHTYFIDVYYKNQLFDSYGYGNTLIIQLPEEEESGDSGEIIVDLTETNQKLDNIANIIESGNNKIIETLESGNSQIISALTDDTIPSGEEPTFEDLPTIEVEDISEDFFTWLLTEFVDCIDFSGDTYIDIPVYGNNVKRIYSNEFVLSLEPLKTFIQFGWWFLCGVPFLKFIRFTIEKLKGGNIPLSDEKSDLLGHIL